MLDDCKSLYVEMVKKLKFCFCVVHYMSPINRFHRSFKKFMLNKETTESVET